MSTWSQSVRKGNKRFTHFRICFDFLLHYFEHSFVVLDGETVKSYEDGENNSVIEGDDGSPSC